MRQQPFASPEEALAHFGTKGMKWGVRNLDRKYDASQRLKTKAHQQEEQSVEPGTGNLKRTFLQKRGRVNRIEGFRLEDSVSAEVRGKTQASAKQDLKALHNKPEFKNINYRDEKGHPQFDLPAFRKMEKEEARIWGDHLNKVVEGQQKFEVKVSKSGKTWEITPKRVKHVAEDSQVLFLRPIRDEDGYLIDVEVVDSDDSMAQSTELIEGVLEHFGKKGMKWGVRNEDKPVGRDSGGQMVATPKPALSEKKQLKVEKFQKRSDVMGTKISELKVANEALAGTKSLDKRYERHINNQSLKQLEKDQKRALRDAEAVQKGKLTSTQKKVVIGAVAVSAIAAYAVYARGQQSGAFNSASLRGSAFLRGEKIPFNVNKSLTGKMSASELLNNVAKQVNPGYSGAGGKMNCRRSTYAYELRRRGFDVHATTSALGWGQSESGVINALTPGSDNFYRSMSMSSSVVATGKSGVASGDKRVLPVAKILLENLKNDAPVNFGSGRLGGASALLERTSSSSKRVLEELAKQPNGARGEVLFKFPGFGHSMAYEIVDGVPHIFDSQKGTLYNASKMVESKWDGFSAAEIMRLDNANLDLKFLTRWADNVGGK